MTLVVTGSGNVRSDAAPLWDRWPGALRDSFIRVVPWCGYG